MAAQYAPNFIVGQAQQVVLKHKEQMKILTTKAHKTVKVQPKKLLVHKKIDARVLLQDFFS
jgi:hypothetical protein